MESTTIRGRVYVVYDDGSKDFTPASAYGDVEALSHRDMTIIGDTGPQAREMERRLGKFCDDDYLLLVGDPVMIGAAVHYAARANGGRVRCLKWDGRERAYVVVGLRL